MRMKEIEKTYDPAKVEEKTYQRWMEKDYFHAEVDPSKEPYCIVIPPPNITGQLHMGRLNNTLQDILIRFRRMQGYNAMWLPGTDHASIATEVKIVEKMAEEGLKGRSRPRGVSWKGLEVEGRIRRAYCRAA